MIEIQYFLYFDDFDCNVDSPPFAMNPSQRYFHSGGLCDTLIIFLVRSPEVAVQGNDDDVFLNELRICFHRKHSRP